MGIQRVSLIMAGGSGTRFWPVSTAERPKQFLNLASPDKSLLEQAVDRAQQLTGESTFVATSASLFEATRSALPQAIKDNVFAEPAMKNTLGALVWSMANMKLRLGSAWRESSVAVLTADHLIAPTQDFVKCANVALSAAESSGSLVTIGVKPTRAATEYGYVERARPLSSGVWRAKRFAEKPDASTAKSFVASGDYFWNSGMFFWTTVAFETALREHVPEASRVMTEIESALVREDNAAAQRAFESLSPTSIDYALMEKAENVQVVEAAFDWDDLGSWDALSRSLPQDQNGNVHQGDARFVDTDGSVVYNGAQETRVSILGLQDVIVVVTKGEVMVCAKDHAQEVRRLVD